jgi:hypothetical protein
VSAASGPLVTRTPHAGSETVTFSAVDRGVGVFRAVAEARLGRAGEWREMASAPLAIFAPLSFWQTPGRKADSCVPLRESSYLYEFDRRDPCPYSVTDASLTLDNRKLPAGEHDLRVVVEDAAGNRTDVIPARRHVVAAPPAPVVASAPPAAPGVAAVEAGVALAPRAAQLQITAPASRRLPSGGPFRLSGRLLDADAQPIAGAALMIRTRPFLPKLAEALGAWTDLGETVTDVDGSFQARIPAGTSRSLLVTYRRSPADADPAATALTDVLVPTRITVNARRTRVRNGRSAVFRGRVAGPIPRGGVLVALEVREPGRWIPVATTRRWVRTTDTGAFQLAYRFTSTYVRTTYRFRVVSGEDSDFQYTRGTSRTIPIHVRP